MSHVICQVYAELDIQLHIDKSLMVHLSVKQTNLLVEIQGFWK